MDPRYQELIGFTNEIRFQSASDHTFLLYSNTSNNYVNEIPNIGNGVVGYNNSNNDPCTTNLSSSLSFSKEDNLQEELDFSDSILRYINQILVEEDVASKGCMLQDSLQHQALQDSQNPLYDVGGKTYPPQLELQPNATYFCSNFNNPDSCFSDDFRDGSGGNNSLWADPFWAYGKGDCCSSEFGNSFYQPPLSSSSFTSAAFGMNGGLGPGDSHSSSLAVPPLCVESPTVFNFEGVDVANKFLTDDSDLLLGVDINGLHRKADEICNKSLVNVGLKKDNIDSRDECRVRKYSFDDNVGTEEEERCSKLAATYDDSDIRSDMFDKILLHHGGDRNELVGSLRTTLLQSAAVKKQQNEQSNGSGGLKGRGRKQSGKKEVVDLRSLLTSCAQSVAADDRRTANELLKQIRQHSSPLGDGNQRLAHYLADGLEARLAGTGSRIYKELTNKRTNASDVLIAYLLYLAACPFKKLSNFFSNKSIAKLTRKANKIHIIDFGILYGFQWPTFIQRQSMREGGPPKIKITGIDFPQPGFRPAERVEETGRRLEIYAQEFKVPFEYHAIAKRWDTIQPEDLNIDEDEVLIVNCIYRMKNLPDETVSVESSRNIVLKLMRKLNPDLFIHGVVNGAYSAPFFVTRFREALFHFSAQFDMLETVVPHDCGERMLIERDLLAREALNVVACEGWERVERPETYKLWKIRTIRAGFTQLPLDSEIKERALRLVHSAYHKDFMIDEDSKWLLLGWKGRVLFALSTWQPA